MNFDEMYSEINPDEFLKLLEEIVKHGTIVKSVIIEKNTIIPNNYQLIIDALTIVCKIGGMKLQDGIVRLSEDYPNNVYSELPCSRFSLPVRMPIKQ